MILASRKCQIELAHPPFFGRLPARKCAACQVFPKTSPPNGLNKRTPHVRHTRCVWLAVMATFASRCETRPRLHFGNASVVKATAFVTVLALNFSDRQAPVELQLPHLYSVRDQQFTRSMSGFLGPSIVAGNKVSELLNGDQIFPSMLGASRQLKHHQFRDLYLLVG